MELHAFQGPGPVAQAHHHPVVGPGRDLRHVGDAVAGHDQRMVAGGGEGLRQAAEDRLAVVVDLRGLAVHELRRAHHLPAEGLAQGLVAEAHPEERDPARGPA